MNTVDLNELQRLVVCYILGNAPGADIRFELL